MHISTTLCDPTRFLCSQFCFDQHNGAKTRHRARSPCHRTEGFSDGVEYFDEDEDLSEDEDDDYADSDDS